MVDHPTAIDRLAGADVPGGAWSASRHEAFEPAAPLAKSRGPATAPAFRPR